MEALIKNYTSDSSDNEDSPFTNNESVSDTCKETKEIKQVGDKPAGLIVDLDDVDSNKSESYMVNVAPSTMDKDQRAVVSTESNQLIPEPRPVVDFFGLSNKKPDEELDIAGGNLNRDGSTCSRTENINVEGNVIPVEIPGSGFWSDFNSSDLQNLQNRFATKQSRDFKSTNQRKRNFSNFEQKKTDISNLQNSAASVTLKHSSSEIVPEIQTETCDSYRNSATIKQTQTRKLYFIHPKIAPLLHNKTQTCRVPSRQEWNCQGHGGAVNRIKWNVPSYSHLFVTCSMDSMIKIWNIWSQLDPCVKIITHHNKAVRDVDWSQDGKLLLSCSYDKTAAVTDVEKGNLVCRLEHTTYVSCGKWHPNNPSLCVTGGHNQLQAYDVRTPIVPVRCYEYKDNFGQVQDVLFVSDGSSFFSCSDLVSRDSADRNLMAWDFAAGVTLSNQIYQERYTISRLKMHPYDGNFLAQSNGNYIAIFSTTRPYKMNRQKRFEGHRLLGYSLGFDITQDGSTVLSGSSDGKIHCYSYQNGKQFKTIHTDMDVVMDLSFHPLLPSTLACCAWDGSVQVWK